MLEWAGAPSTLLVLFTVYVLVLSHIALLLSAILARLQARCSAGAEPSAVR